MRRRRPHPSNPRSGAALLLSVLVLIVLITIVFQIRVTTMTGARVTRNDIGLTTMELAIDAAKLEVFEQLKADAEAAESGGAAGGAGALPGGAIGGAGADPAAGPGAAEGGGEEAPASDSREDEWARPQRPEVNRIQLRVLVIDEDRKYNLLNMLSPDEELAEEAFQRVVRILDACREGTTWDIDTVRSEEMARAMREYMLQRDSLDVPRPVLLTLDEERDELTLPFTVREFLVLEPFFESDFRDFRDEDGAIVHSVEAFLTIWTSPGVLSDLPGAEQGSAAAQPGGSAPGGSTAGQAGSAGSGQAQSGQPPSGQATPGQTAPGDGADPGAQGEGAEATQAAQAAQGSQGTDPGGYGVNLNTAPVAVLKSLLDSREVSPRFWDDVIEYRNEEEEEDPAAAEEDVEPIYDEFGEEIVPRKIFDSLDELAEVRSWDDYDPDTQQRIRSLLTTESRVFSVYLTARRSTTGDDDYSGALSGEELAREEEQAGKALVRTVRTVIWRRPGTDGVEIVPIVPWDYVDYAPFEISDYPEEERDYRR